MGDKKAIIELTDKSNEKKLFLRGVDLTKYLISYECKSTPDNKVITLKLSVANDDIKFLVGL